VSEKRGLTYSDAGVDLDRGDAATRGISALVDSTRTEGVLSGVGSFGGLFRMPEGVDQPVLVASTDGVGTKLKVAIMAGRHDTVGEDLVNHCVDDILVQGARPLFFLDYVGLGRLEPGVVEEIVEGIARGCRTNGCALLGGETAEMPDFYAPGDYDLAGTIVGVVEEGGLIDGSAIRAGDVLVGIASNGLHTNGYSLARKIVFERMGLGVDDPFPEMDGSVADELLRVHRSYLPALNGPIARGQIRGMAHITGGGIAGNLRRVLPDGCEARIDRTSWEVPAVFRVLAEAGGVDREEMFRAFNMGVGMICAVPRDAVDDLIVHLGEMGEEGWVMGEVRAGDGGVILDY
jgi:phosphoribosylformylglycinamidine cyclo-ligase